MATRVRAARLKSNSAPGLPGREEASAPWNANARAGPSWPLKQPGLLDKLTTLQLEKLAAMTHRRSYKPGELLFQQGDLQERVFVIRTGTVRAFYTAATGREITLAYWQDGDLLGALGVFGRAAYGWSCQAVTSTEGYAILGTDMRTLVSTMPEFALTVVEALSFKVQWLSRLIQMFGTESVSERLAHLLDTLCELYGQPQKEGIAISTPLTHEDLAAMVGASRQWVTTALAAFQERGIIKIRKRQLLILQRALLRG